MASSPVTSKTDLVTFNIKSGGSTIKDTYQILSVYIENKINHIPYCELEILDGSAAKQDFPISDSDTFAPGAEIEVLAGYENKNTSVFKGIVLQHSISVKSDTGSVLRVVCKDKAVKMTVGRNNAYFTKTTDSSIISKLIQDHGLSADVTSTSNQLKEVIQYYSTDWDFMISRAEVNGMVVFAKDGKIFVKNPDEETEEVLSLTYGDDIIEFDGVIDAEYQLKKVKTNAWDPKNQVVSSGSATPSNLEIGNLTTEKLAEVIGLPEYNLQTIGPLESDALETWAKAKATKSEYAKVRGHVKFQGSAKAEPTKLIELKGMGKRFNGKVFVSGVIHDIKDGNWLTTVQIGLSPEWFTARVKTEAPMAAGLLPGIEGLQMGIVKQISEDPDEEFRVLVTLPLIQSGNDGVWARLSTFYATNESGVFFYPEVDDEVVVGFFNNDPRYPVILGSVYSSNHAAPEKPDEQNTIKGFVSREQMKITFDEEKKIITISTPGNNLFKLDDEDKSITLSDPHNNYIKISDEGIEINSARSISINAEESISLNANTGIRGSAPGGDISLDAINISTTAEAELNASGAMVAISGDGEMTLNAAMIMIN